INKGDWNSFEDGKMHESVHLMDEKPNLFENFTREERQNIEKNPEQLYLELTPEIILNRLKPYLQYHLKNLNR
ncbi:MAG: lipopolysaccharide heptosyltransferase family protein, partial [Bacteroidetes bacterium]